MRIAAIAVASLLLAGSAAAARKPTARESAALRSAIHGFIAMPSSPSARDNRIATLRVSTLDKRYAAARLTSPTVGAADLVLHESNGFWFIEEFGSSLNCDAGPKAVLADLKIGCTPPGATAWISDCGPLVAHPAKLTLACAGASITLVHLRWTGWGKATAAGTGSLGDYPVRAAATRLTTCGRARYYAQLNVVFTGKHPSGPSRLTFTPSC